MAYRFWSKLPYDINTNKCCVSGLSKSVENKMSYNLNLSIHNYGDLEQSAWKVLGTALAF